MEKPILVWNAFSVETFTKIAQFYFTADSAIVSLTMLTMGFDKKKKKPSYRPYYFEACNRKHKYIFCLNIYRFDTYLFYDLQVRIPLNKCDLTTTHEGW
jgi:hypothetical protein